MITIVVVTIAWVRTRGDGDVSRTPLSAAERYQTTLYGDYLKQCNDNAQKYLLLAPPGKSINEYLGTVADDVTLNRIKLYLKVRR